MGLWHRYFFRPDSASLGQLSCDVPIWRRNKAKKISCDLSFATFFPKNLPSIDGTNCQKVTDHFFEKVNRKFFMNFLMSAEVYFRSPFSHLPVRFRHSRICSSLIFSANFGISCAPVLGRQAEKPVFSPPPVYPVKQWVTRWSIYAWRRNSAGCDPSHPRGGVRQPVCV